MWHGRPLTAWGGTVVADEADLLALYMPEGGPLLRRTERGVDTHDLELDIVVSLDGSWHLKDDEQLEGWVERGRWTYAEVAEIRAEAFRVGGLLDQGCNWWGDEWAEWRPDPEWRQPTLPSDWDRA